MTQRTLILSAPLRHSAWGVFPQLLLLALLANVLCAANLPTFSYSSSKWLANEVQLTGIASDSAGNTYITGATPPGAIATTPGAFQSQDNSNGTCSFAPMIGAPIPCTGSFVEKLDPTGTVIFATYFSGNGNTTVNGLAIDQQGYLCGGKLHNFN